MFAAFAVSRRAAPKNHTRSRRTGPPNVPSCVVLSALAFSTPVARCSGVSSIHAGFAKPSRTLPLKALPPLRVTTLMTPPEKRPYSAETPCVKTVVS